MTNQLDSWINGRCQGLAPDPVIGERRFRLGGPGVAEDWDAIGRGVATVRAAAREYLEPLTDDGLEATVSYDGSIELLRGRQVPLRYFLLHICAHHYFHLGEITSKRDRLGHAVGDYPGLMEQCMQPDPPDAARP